MSSDRVAFLVRLEDIARDCGLEGEIQAAFYVLETGLAAEPEFLEFCKRYLQGEEFYGF